MYEKEEIVVAKSRIYNSTRNIFSGLIKQIMNIVLPFIIRTIIIYSLGSKYQGISGLFSSILQVLSLADLGFSTAVVFSLYKPISEKNNKLINALMLYLKKIYQIIGAIVLILGLCLLPFLKYLINGSIPSDINIYILYLIYLFNSVISYYLFAYKSALFTAMQREDITSNIYTITSIFIKILQIVFLIIFKNYYIFILIQPIGTAMNNILLQIYSKKMFPNIYPDGEIPNENKKNLSKQVRALFISRVADVARNSLDNIIISSFIGLSAVAAYDNYLYIFTGLRGFFLVLMSGMQASIGNSIVEETVEKNYNDLHRITHMYMLLTSICTTCLFCLYQPFMQIWMKNNTDLILSNACVVLFCIYFYEINMNNTINLYLNGNGLYWNLRWWYIIESLVNLLLNILLGKTFGIFGVLLATVITIFLFNFIPRVTIVFKEYFKVSSKKYYINNIKYFAICTIISCFILKFCSFICIDGVVGFLIKGFISLGLSLLFYYFIYKNSRYYIGLNSLLKKRREGNKKI